MFLRRFYPDFRMESVYKIDFQKLYDGGVRGVLFDIDNTLVPHGAPADDAVIALFARLRAIGLKTCLISNNQAPRILPFARAVDSAYICNAHKPSRTGYEKAMAQMGTGRAETIFVGDQLFTDVYGAKRAGISAWLVAPIHPKEEIQIVLKRYLERVVLYFYERENGQRRHGAQKPGRKRTKMGKKL